jgi:excinuclease UvrABC nuclease subunit
VNDFPNEPGVYVFYDISDRPIYVGESGDIRRRIRQDHIEKFWYRTPIVEKASYVRVDDQTLRRQLENTLIKFLKSNAVINQRQVDR